MKVLCMCLYNIYILFDFIKWGRNKRKGKEGNGIKKWFIDYGQNITSELSLQVSVVDNIN